MCPVSSSTATHPRTYLYPSLHRADRVRHDVGDSPTDATGSESADLVTEHHHSGLVTWLKTAEQERTKTFERPGGGEGDFGLPTTLSWAYAAS